MNIVFVSATFPPTVGGAESYARNLVDDLRGRGHDVVVLTDGSRIVDPPPEARTIRVTGFREDLDRVDKILWQQMYFGILPDAARAGLPAEVDIVHANDQSSAVLASMIGLEYDIPVVATFHEQAPEDEPFGAGRCRLVYGALPITTVIAGSRFYLNRARQFGAGDRAAMVYHGIDLSRFSVAREHRDTAGAAHTPRILCLARLKERKGLSELLAACVRMRADGLRFSLVIAGTCSSASTAYAQSLEDYIVAEDLGDQVRIDRTVGYDDVPGLLATADIYVQPSYEEGLGLSVLEAMAAMVPVIGSDIPAIREIVEHEHNGLLVGPGDVAGIAGALTRLMGDSAAREQFRSAGWQTVSTKFSAERMVDQTLDVYHDAVQVHHGASV